MPKILGIRKSALAIHLCALPLLVLCPTLRASAITFGLGSNPNQIYAGINVGPYTGTVTTAAQITEFFCLDLHLAATFGGTYAGDTRIPTTQQEKEAAFLASYSLFLGAPSSNPAAVNKVEGPISMAIWQIMGSMGSTSIDPAAQSYVNMAQNAYFNGYITPTYLAHVVIFQPSNLGIQRFISAYEDDSLVANATPEPGTLIFICGGLLLIAIGIFRRRRR